MFSLVLSVLRSFRDRSHSRDYLRYFLEVTLEITKTLLVLAVNVYSIIQGYVHFSQIAPIFILFAVFAVAFLTLYPWRVASRRA